MEIKNSHKRINRRGWMVLLWILLVSFPTLSYAKPTEEERLVIRKTYQLSSDQILGIRNRYGDVNINSWEKSYAQVVITIIARSSDKSRAQERLEEVEIRERKLSGKIQLETEILSRSFSILRQQGIEVIYDVDIPTQHSLEIENRFGDVYLDSRLGTVDIDVKNGNLVAKELSGEDNRIKLQFGQADLTTFKGGTLDISFGQLFLTEADVLSLKSNGAVIKIDQVKQLQLNANLGEIRVREADEITGSYTSTKVSVERLNKRAELDIKAAIAFEIEEVAAGFEGIVLTGNFTAINLGFEDEAAFDVDAEVQFGELTSHNLGVELKSTAQAEKLTHYLTPTTVKANPSSSVARSGKPGQVKIHSKYGNVRLSKG
jgi:hypothetical protein